MELNRGLATLLAFLLIASITITGITLNEQFTNQTENLNQTSKDVCQTVNKTFDNRTMYHDNDTKKCIDSETNESWERR